MSIAIFNLRAVYGKVHEPTNDFQWHAHFQDLPDHLIYTVFGCSIDDVKIRLIDYITSMLKVPRTDVEITFQSYEEYLKEVRYIDE